MIHSSQDHRLYENDLVRHLSECHDIQPQYARKDFADRKFTVDEWRRIKSIVSTGDPELDILLWWHDVEHDRDEAEHAVENALWTQVERVYSLERQFYGSHGGLLPNVAGDHARREQARLNQVQTETWLTALAVVRGALDSATSFEDHLVAVSDQFTEKLVGKVAPAEG